MPSCFISCFACGGGNPHHQFNACSKTASVATRLFLLISDVCLASATPGDARSAGREEDWGIGDACPRRPVVVPEALRAVGDDVASAVAGRLDSATPSARCMPADPTRVSAAGGERRGRAVAELDGRARAAAVGAPVPTSTGD